MNNTPSRLDELIECSADMIFEGGDGYYADVAAFLRSYQRLLSLIDVEALEAGAKLCDTHGVRSSQGFHVINLGPQHAASLRALAEAAKGMK
jgi:hypothetical protein